MQDPILHRSSPFPRTTETQESNYRHINSYCRGKHTHRRPSQALGSSVSTSELRSPLRGIEYAPLTAFCIQVALYDVGEFGLGLVRTFRRELLPNQRCFCYDMLPGFDYLDYAASTMEGVMTHIALQSHVQALS